MTQHPFIPLTDIDCTIPALFIDRNTPLDLLHANAVARMLAATQLMETLSSRELQQADSVDLKHLATAAALPVGANVVLFTQRYEVGREEVTASIAVSTSLALVTIPLILLGLAQLLKTA